MSKKKSKIKLCILALVAVLGIFLTCFSFRIPFTHYTWEGFANAISMGLDIKGGVLAVYEAEVDEKYQDEFDTRLDATIMRIEDFLVSKGYTEAMVSKQGSSRIRVEVPDVNDPDTIFTLIGEPAELYFTDSEGGEAIITGEHIESCSAAYEQGSGNGVSITFTSEGSKLFSDLTSNKVGSQIYIYIDGELYSAPTVNEAITGGRTFISGDFTQAQAEQYAMKILSGTFQVNLNVVSNSVVSATLGAEALKYGIIAGLIGLVAIFVFMAFAYGVLGLLADFALVFFIILFAFFLQAIPLVQLTLPGIAGIILTLGMAVDGNVIIFERIKEEYRKGKKIPASVKSGYKRALTSILDGNITTIIASIVLYILGTGSIKGFAIVLFIGTAVSLFTSTVVTKGLVNLYLPINSTKAKPYKLKREGKINEI